MLQINKFVARPKEDQLINSVLIAGLIAAFIWGLRHGIDWDHIAAITDITSSQESTRSGVKMGTLYALGHSFVVSLLGLLAIGFGKHLPSWLDNGMGFFVGLTLVIMGIYVVIGLNRLRRGSDFKIRSRWWILINLLSHAYERIRAVVTRTVPRKPRKFFENYVPKTAFTVGMIHGIGVETPTQVLLFVGAAGFAGSATALLLLAAFILGMLVTNTTMIVASSFGFVSLSRSRALLVGAAVATAAYSLIVGALFLSGADSILPAFFEQQEAIGQITHEP